MDSRNNAPVDMTRSIARDIDVCIHDEIAITHNDTNTITINFIIDIRITNRSTITSTNNVTITITSTNALKSTITIPNAKL